jgi:hypothetical protein
VPRQKVTQQKIAEHVQRLGELYPPISLDSVDRTVKRPDLVMSKYGHVIDYLARVELEVDRNVLELLVLLPDVDDTNRTFYADVWQPQEIRHGVILDRLLVDGHYIVPLYDAGGQWVARWKHIGRPDHQPLHGFELRTAWRNLK